MARHFRTERFGAAGMTAAARTAARVAVVAIALVAGGSAALGQEPVKDTAAPAPCGTEEFDQFAFWVGTWDVFDGEGKQVGENRITRILDGCVLLEEWAGATGHRGRSFNIYDARRGVWHQTWVDHTGLLLVLEGGLRDGSMVLEGRLDRPDSDSPIDNRVTWIPSDDGSVRQHWQQSGDDGETWRTVFDGTYRPAS